MRIPPLAPMLLALLLVVSAPSRAQVDEDQLGAWYMYFFNGSVEGSRWGFQGDAQYRNWNLVGDLEQLLLRSGVSWSPADFDVKLTLGYASITTGEFDSSRIAARENRIYQEALLPHRVGPRILLRHRFRYEQRFVEEQDFRTRFRYALFVDVPLNRTDLRTGAFYLAFYNEVFVNGERDIAAGRQVDYFDRNRLYGALGYSLSDALRVQAGYMYQATPDVQKGQVQLSLTHAFRLGD